MYNIYYFFFSVNRFVFNTFCFDNSKQLNYIMLPHYSTNTLYVNMNPINLSDYKSSRKLYKLNKTNNDIFSKFYVYVTIFFLFLM